ncbi:MAG: hypothetical protein WAV78_47830 [Xanthobacteraceae bacterium]
MSKTFRAWKIDEPLFLPPTVQDFVAEDHLARFVLSLVRDDLDLIEISGTYGSERGSGKKVQWHCTAVPTSPMCDPFPLCLGDPITIEPLT